MEFKDLTPEQQDRLKACKTQEELMDLADELDIDLPSEYLQAITGGLNPSIRRHDLSCLTNNAIG